MILEKRTGRLKPENKQFRSFGKVCVHHAQSQAVNVSLRSRRELLITDTELTLIAAAAIMGDSKIPNAGNRTPAATGTPRAL